MVSNNLNVAKILSENKQTSIIMAGGKVHNRDAAVTGLLAVETFQRYRMNIGIIGISGIDQDGALFDFDLDEVLCAQAIMRNA